MKDQWKLLEESISGNFGSYLSLNEKAQPQIIRFFLLLSGGQEDFAIAQTINVISESFSSLKKKSTDILFLNFILSHYKFSPEDIKLANLSTREDFQSFLSFYCKKFSYGLYIIEPINTDTNPEFIDSKFLGYFKSLESLQTDKVDNVIIKVNTQLQSMIKSKSFYRIPNWLILGVVFLITFVCILFLPISNKADKQVTTDGSIEQAPVNKIFDDYLNKLRNTLQDEVVSESNDKNSANSEEIINEPSDNEIIEESEMANNDNKADEPGNITMPSPDEEVNKGQKQDENKIENESIGAVKDKSKDVEIQNDAPVEDDSKKENAEPDLVVVKDKTIPLLPDLNRKDDVIVLGDNSKKRSLKEFQDQKVVFYSFLEVKDIEKAKNEAFKILEKFGYKGTVLKKEKDYIILTATFPGKENHDKMIKKFNGLGTLYVGNDVAEFLELYKKDLDQEKSEFFPKYKPEDLPKEVTVNLYVFPKQKK